MLPRLLWCMSCTLWCMYVCLSVCVLCTHSHWLSCMFLSHLCCYMLHLLLSLDNLTTVVDCWSEPILCLSILCILYMYPSVSFLRWSLFSWRSYVYYELKEPGQKITSTIIARFIACSLEI